MQIDQLRAWIEHIEGDSKVPDPPITPDTTKGTAPRSNSPPAESIKKRQKGTNPVCNTSNVIMGSQDNAPDPPCKQKEPRLRHRRMAN
eukprot:8299721-Ditylum_brightwellii.AAC.3